MTRDAASGMLSAAQDYDMGGMQLPDTVDAAANAFFAMASISISSSLLSAGNANLLMVHGTDLQKRCCAQRILGRFSGMCLSEPQAGSSLSDVATRAVPDEAFGSRGRRGALGTRSARPALPAHGQQDVDFIGRARSVGEHRPPGAGQDSGAGWQAGAGHARHFAVHRAQRSWWIPGPVDRRAQRCGAGGPGTTSWAGAAPPIRCSTLAKANTRCRAGRAPATWWASPAGPACMFHMMNEARIGIGMAATMLGLAGLLRQPGLRQEPPQAVCWARGQGCGPAAGAHHRARRRQAHAAGAKSYGEGALALNLFCARLVDEQHTGAPDAADEARLLLEVLTPIAKAGPASSAWRPIRWPSRSRRLWLRATSR